MRAYSAGATDLGQLSGQLLTWLLPYLLPAARTVGVMAFLPGIGAQTVPPPVRLAVALGVAFLVASACGPSAAPLDNPLAFMVALMAELGLGLTVGWLATVLFEALRWAGEILDLQLGLRAGEVFDPITAQGSSQLGHLYHRTALTIFFVLDGHHWVLAALAHGLERVPPGQIAVGAPLLRLLTGELASSMDIVARAGAAGIAALLLADVALAIVGRHVPQMNVFLVGIPAKLGAGLLVLAVSAPLLVWAMGALMADVKHYVPAVLGP